MIFKSFFYYMSFGFKTNTVLKIVNMEIILEPSSPQS